ncbi:TonB-dependent receptor [Sphingomonas sp. ASY06-1R]|uniref:TonB-dependent receptor n=1 Tax=Sphingomonas sp. ASY06-1R TaxID=3445771 RepID=UPI003FA1FF61
MVGQITRVAKFKLALVGSSFLLWPSIAAAAAAQTEPPAGPVELASAATAVTTAAVAAPGMGATAQDGAAGTSTDAADPAEIIVTGFRSSLRAALDLKRNTVNLTESVLAEDMAKMPDLNLSESIQRVPGVAISREGGEGRNITLRGFAPDFTRTTLNGMEVPASTDGLDSGGFTVNSSRGFDFNVFASELFNRIDVQKTQRASVEEGGIAGSIDLYSGRPFDRPGLHLVASGQGSYNSVTRKVDPRAAFLFSDTFADDKLGILLSAAYSKRTVYQEGRSSVLWTSPFINGDSWADTNPKVTGTPQACGAANPLDCLWAPRLPRADFFGNNQKRLGLSGALQFRPDDRLTLTASALFSRLDNDRNNYNSMEWLLTHGPAGNFVGQTPLSFTVSPNGKELIAASFNDVTSWYENRRQSSRSTFQQYVGNVDYKITDQLSFAGLIGKARDSANRDELRFYARSIPHPYSYDYSASRDEPQVNFGSYDPNDADNYVDALTSANRLNSILKDNFTAKGDLTFREGNLIVKAGAVFNRRLVRYGEAAGTNPTLTGISAYMKPFPIPHFGSGVIDGGLPTFAVIDFDAIDKAGLIPNQYVDNIGADWQVIERTKGGYIELNNSFPLGTMTLRLNAGARYVGTTVSSSATLANSPVRVKHDYNNFLPSANAVLEFTPDVLVRAAYGRSLTRPSLSALNIAGPVFGYDTRTVSNLGNPFLKPYLSNDYDLNFEWYFAKGGLLSAGVFYKDIISSLTTSIVTQKVPEQYWAAIYADPRYNAAYQADPATVPYTFTTAVNTPDGNRVKGVELTANVPFSIISDRLSAVGIASNYTYVHARDTTGLSPNSYNLTVYYDTGSCGIRASLNHRDSYLISIPGGNGNAAARKSGSTQVDVSAYWNLTKRLTLNLQGINVNNQRERYYDTGDGTQFLTREYTGTGRTILAGIRYQF